MRRSSTISENPCQYRTAIGLPVEQNLRKAAALFVLLVVVAPLQAQTGKSSDINLSRLAEAVTAISEGQLTKAESLLDSVLASAPNDADALNLLGVVRAQEQKPAEAERLFRRALSASPSHLGAHINLGKLLLTTKRPEQAMQILLTAHRLAPERAEINLNLATLYADRGDYQRALEYLRLVPPSDASDDYFPVLLRSLLGLNQLEEARRLAREFIESVSGKPEAQAE